MGGGHISPPSPAWNRVKTHVPYGSNVIIIDIRRLFLQIDLFLDREHFPAMGGFN